MRRSHLHQHAVVWRCSFVLLVMLIADTRDLNRMTLPQSQLHCCVCWVRTSVPARALRQCATFGGPGDAHAVGIIEPPSQEGAKYLGCSSQSNEMIKKEIAHRLAGCNNHLMVFSAVLRAKLLYILEWVSVQHNSNE